MSQGDLARGWVDVAAEQDAVSKAMDSTATQWSFQFAWQVMPDYHEDVLPNGETRKPGNTDFAQLRIVAPIPLKSFTILPRLTIRHYENAQGESGIGNTELFGLIVPKKWDWGTGRIGLGPLITAPGDEEVARDEWGYGFAAAVVNSAGKWFYGMLLTQSWRAVDPTIIQPGSSDTNPFLRGKLVEPDTTKVLSWHQCPSEFTTVSTSDGVEVVTTYDRSSLIESAVDSLRSKLVIEFFVVAPEEVVELLDPKEVLGAD